MPKNRETSKGCSWELSIGVLTLLFSVVAASAAILVVPEVRQLVGLDPRTKSPLENVEALQAGVDIGVYEDKFGKPVFINRFDNKKLKEYVFVNTHFYLDAITDTNDSVKYFAVTVRDGTFHPAFKNPFPLTLGVSKFSDVPGPDYVVGCTFLKSFTYYETHYLAGAGNYQDIGFGINPAGYIPNGGDRSLGDLDQHREYCQDETGLVHVEPDLKVLERLRSQTTINTYALSSPGIRIKDNIVSSYLGVDYTQVQSFNG